MSTAIDVSAPPMTAVVIGSTSVVALMQRVPPAWVRSTTPSGVAVAAHPGGTATVVSSCSRMAGPATGSPATSASRSTCGVGSSTSSPSTRQVATGTGAVGAGTRARLDGDALELRAPARGP